MDILAAQFDDLNPNEKAQRLSTWAYMHLRHTEANVKIVDDVKKLAGNKAVCEKDELIFIIP